VPPLSASRSSSGGSASSSRHLLLQTVGVDLQEETRGCDHIPVSWAEPARFRLAPPWMGSFPVINPGPSGDGDAIMLSARLITQSRRRGSTKWPDLSAVILAVLGVGAYSFVDSGTHDVAFRNDFQYSAVSDWMLVAGLVAVILFLFLIQAVCAAGGCAGPTAKAVDRRLSEQGFRSAADSRGRSPALTRPGRGSGIPRPPRVLPVTDERGRRATHRDRLGAYRPTVGPSADRTTRKRAAPVPSCGAGRQTPGPPRTAFSYPRGDVRQLRCRTRW